MSAKHPTRWCVSLVWLSVLLTSLSLSTAALEFDHEGSGYPLTGAHVRASCDSCHVQNRFAGTPRDCAGCHSASSNFPASRQPVHHVLTTQRCAQCHRSSSWRSVTRVDHLEVIGSCSSCHDGVRAQGQFFGHIPTAADCSVCHSTRSFARGVRPQ